MKPARGRVSGVTILVIVVMLLVPLLAWLQYRWLGQVADAERERMQRTLKTSATQFATSFDSELSKAMVGLQVEGAVLRDENWASYAQRYSAWTERALDPRLVKAVLLVDTPEEEKSTKPGRSRDEAKRDRDGPDDQKSIDPERLRVRHWNNDSQAFDPAEWNDQLEVMRAVLAQHLGEIRVLRAQGSGRFRREGSLSFAVGDDYTLVSPITYFHFAGDRRSPARIDILGFVLIRLDPEFVRGTLLPMLAASHFHAADGTADEYRIAVLEREGDGVIWESEPGAAAVVRSSPDVVQPFRSPRPDQVFMFARTAGASRPIDGTEAQPPPPPPPPPDERIVISVLQDRRASGPAGSPEWTERTGRPFSPFEGRWSVAATHRAGSLDNAVAALRVRNLVLSSSILVLLTAAIALIVISSRRAQHLARQQMEFVAAVSHELRTPVSVIGTAAGNLADGVVVDPVRVKTYGATIQGEARRLGETVERVLQLAGIAAGRAAAARVPVEAGELVRESINACRLEMDRAGVEVELAIAESLPPVEGDPAALRSALQNLIVNAVKYGGEVRWVRVEAASYHGLGRPAVAFSVADRGLGIGPEDRKHIFEPFYRGREAVSRQITGSGLGLNLVSRIAEAHGGRVLVSSDPGVGSTFTLVLPAAPPRTTGSLAGAKQDIESLGTT